MLKVFKNIGTQAKQVMRLFGASTGEVEATIIKNQ